MNWSHLFPPAKNIPVPTSVRIGSSGLVLMGGQKELKP
jgi:hypothetical protein